MDVDTKNIVVYGIPSIMLTDKTIAMISGALVQNIASDTIEIFLFILFLNI